MSHYIIQTACAKMPRSVKSHYRRVAVLEVEDGVGFVSMISERARGCIRIVETWERLHAVGKNTAYARGCAEARDLAEELNAQQSPTQGELA